MSKILALEGNLVRVFLCLLSPKLLMLETSELGALVFELTDNQLLFWDSGVYSPLRLKDPYLEIALGDTRWFIFYILNLIFTTLISYPIEVWVRVRIPEKWVLLYTGARV